MQLIRKSRLTFTLKLFTLKLYLHILVFHLMVHQTSLILIIKKSMCKLMVMKSVLHDFVSCDTFPLVKTESYLSSESKLPIASINI